MSRAAVHAARAAAAINHLNGKFNKTVFGEQKERYINLCALKARVGKLWYGDSYVFDEDYCRRRLVEGTTDSRRDMLGPMSKFSIVLGVIDTGLKSVGTLVMAYKKGPKEGTTDIVKSVTGIDNKEMADSVKRLVVLVTEIHRVVTKKQSQVSVSHRGGGGAADKDGGGAAVEDGGEAADEDGGD